MVEIKLEKMQLPEICPICRETEFLLWCEKSGYKIKKCRKCSHVCVLPLPSFQQIKEGYTNEDNPFIGVYSDNSKDEHGYYFRLRAGEATHTEKVANMALKFIPRFGNSQGKRWLDIGAGSGYMVMSARINGWDAEGIEPGPWGMKAAQEKNIPVIRDFFETHDFNGMVYDVITAMDVVEHSRDPRNFVKKCREILKPDGLIVLSVPCSSSPHGWTRFLRVRWPMVGPPGHLHYFSKKSLTLLLKSFGFDILYSQTFEESGLSILGKYSRFFAKIQDMAYRSLVKFLNLGDQIIVIGSAK